MSKGRVLSTFVCPVCGLRILRPRPSEFKRNVHNSKIMFCVKCKKDSDFEEIDYFLWEAK